MRDQEESRNTSENREDEITIPVGKWRDKILNFFIILKKAIIYLMSIPKRILKFSKNTEKFNIFTNLLLFVATMLLIIVTIYSASIALYTSNRKT